MNTPREMIWRKLCLFLFFPIIKTTLSAAVAKHMTVTHPPHGAQLALPDIDKNFDTILNISFEVPYCMVNADRISVSGQGTSSSTISGASSLDLCARINGSSVGCGKLQTLVDCTDDKERNRSTSETLGLPIHALAQGRNWFFVELRESGGREVVAASRPVAWTVSRTATSHPIISVAAPTETLSAGGSHHHISSVTMVLTLTMRDAARAMLLFATLGSQQRCTQPIYSRDRDGVNDASDFRKLAYSHEHLDHGSINSSGDGGDKDEDMCWLYEMLVIVPSHEVLAFQGLLPSNPAHSGVRVVDEQVLFRSESGHDVLINPLWDKYALAMAIKLLAAHLVTTDFYVTLDADVLVTRRFYFRDLFTVDTPHRARYIPESRDVHPHWWAGAATMLQIPVDRFASDVLSGPRFGVTPAVLSTAGSLFTTARLRELYEGDGAGGSWLETWLSSWGPSSWWSEYTLYALALHDHSLFDLLHYDDSDCNDGSSSSSSSSSSSNSSSFNGEDKALRAIAPLSCHSVWFEGDLPWDATAAFQAVGTASCPFAVVQSSSGADPSALSQAITAELRHAGNRRLSSSQGNLYEISPEDNLPYFGSIFLASGLGPSTTK